MKRKYWIAAGAAAIAGTVAVLVKQQKPGKAIPVTDFELKKYLGKWYEIARLPYRFEKNLINVKAEYHANDDGSVEVINSGYNNETGNEEVARGRAKFAKASNIGELKVSFFGPFYSGYNIIGTDREYDNALVAGKNLSYLWLLSRSKTMSQEQKDIFLEKAREVGYNTDDLIWTKQE